jgi:hypothetical protein
MMQRLPSFWPLNKRTMADFLRQSELKADLSTLRAMLDHLPKEDTLGRIGLLSRATELEGELAAIPVGENTLASTALYFGGKPVIGSKGIEAEFAATAISDFKDLIVKVWATNETEVATRGPVPNQDSARLHVTALLHGSMGFLIEEIDLRATPLFPTPLKQASDEAVKLIVTMATQSDEEFQGQLETVHARVFSSVQKFFKDLHRAEASVRLVDPKSDRTLSRETVDKAYVRLESSLVEEDPIIEFGRLEGIIPHAGRFEFRSEAGFLREGKVAPTLSEAYLKRLENEQAIGKWFNAKMNRKQVRRFGRTTTTFTLLDLVESAEERAGAPAFNS